MNRIIVDLNETHTVSNGVGTPGTALQPAKRGWFFRFMKITGILLAALIVIGGVGGYLYWQSLKRTPQYSLALLIDAARRNDQAEIDKVVDINAVVDDFVPQITGKAIDMYGRGLPPSTIGKVASVAAPMMPAVKDRARAELPDKIRERTEKFKYVPMPAIVFGADKYLDAAFGGYQSFAALARQLDAVLKQFQAFLERQIAVLELTDDLFQFVERFFKRFFHTRHCTYCLPRLPTAYLKISLAR
jgi:hypothetical protein